MWLHHEFPETGTGSAQKFKSLPGTVLIYGKLTPEFSASQSTIIWSYLSELINSHLPSGHCPHLTSEFLLPLRPGLQNIEQRSWKADGMEVGIPSLFPSSPLSFPILFLPFFVLWLISAMTVESFATAIQTLKLQISSWPLLCGKTMVTCFLSHAESRPQK
jgi:hypothetical protein